MSIQVNYITCFLLVSGRNFVFHFSVSNVDIAVDRDGFVISIESEIRWCLYSYLCLSMSATYFTDGTAVPTKFVRTWTLTEFCVHGHGQCPLTFCGHGMAGTDSWGSAFVDTLVMGCTIYSTL